MFYFSCCHYQPIFIPPPESLNLFTCYYGAIWTARNVLAYVEHNKKLSVFLSPCYFENHWRHPSVMLSTPNFNLWTESSDLLTQVGHARAYLFLHPPHNPGVLGWGQMLSAWKGVMYHQLRDSSFWIVFKLYFYFSSNIKAIISTSDWSYVP